MYSFDYYILVDYYYILVDKVEDIDADYIYISYYTDECEFPIEERMSLIRANNTIMIK